MANNWTDAGEVLALDLFHGGSQGITTPLKLALMTAAGSESAAGTEVTGGSYARQNITFTAASTTSGTTSSSNNAAISFSNMPACTVVGFEVYDSSATPKRLIFAPFTTSRTYTAGDTATVASGAITDSVE